MIKVAMMQLKTIFDDLDSNLQKIQSSLEEIREKNIDIALFPETCDLGWANPNSIHYAQPIPGTVSNFFCEMAKKYHLHIVTGITEKEGAHLYNSALLISPNGKIILKHRKINLVQGVEDMIYSFGQKLEVCNTPLGKIGVNICADNLKSSHILGHTLAEMGADIILSPSAWAVPPKFDQTKTPYGDIWINSYHDISSKHHIPVIGVSNVGILTAGIWKGWKAIGNSIAYNSHGEPIAILPFGDEAEHIHILNVS